MIWFVRNRALPVRAVEGPVTLASDVKMKGGEPVSLRLRLDDGSVVEVAAADRDLVAGPFDAVQAKTAEPAP